MAQLKPISRPWQVATIIGSVWGAFEIVAGSLLHNLAVPMVAGTILSAIGVVVMVTGAKIYGNKGIFWRSALVCAALKTVSPSPVILSPMIGIALEGVLMELGVLILGHNLVGYILGGGLALLSILGFKFVRLIMIYGTDLVEAYKSVFSFAFSTETLTSYGYLLPILLLIVIYMAIGGFAAYTGFKGGISIKARMNGKVLPNLQQSPDGYKPPMRRGQHKGGIAFLIFHILWLTVFITLKENVPMGLWISGGLVYITLCIFRYGRIRAMISRPSFLIIIFLVSVASSITISLGIDGAIESAQQVIHHGLTIFIRASVVIISFTCIGIEMMSKGVSQYFSVKAFASFSHSYQFAHKALPKLLKDLKLSKGQIHKPMPLIERLFSNFAHTSQSEGRQPKVVIITGDKHSGKTTFLKEMIAHLMAKGVQCAGFFAEGFWDNDGKRAGFNLVTLPQNVIMPLSDRHNTSWEQFCPFYYNPQALAAGQKQIDESPKGSIVAMDEIGKQELDGSIWANTLERLLHRNTNSVIITVRKTYLNDVVERWHLQNATVVDATTDCPEEIAKLFETSNN
ncbi:MAG: nucleoside-triphosphatase [Tenuifilaceae bacterium]|jgi:nucleoside-triphosphatase THEP1|nr:nucleoside-triphosphatase [Tenuifilaceae bacterium]